MKTIEQIWNEYQEIHYSKKANNEAFCHLFGALESALTVMENESDKARVIKALEYAVNYAKLGETK